MREGDRERYSVGRNVKMAHFKMKCSTKKTKLLKEISDTKNVFQHIKCYFTINW